jgi:L-iditol 2-dehydrogenase
VTIHGMDLGRLTPGATVAVIGCGPIGLLVVALARLAGAAMIIATDPSRVRLHAASKLGASHTTQANGDDQDGAAVLAATNARGVDVVFEVAGDPAAVACSVTSARPGGRVVLLGIPSDDQTVFPASVARRKGLTFVLARRSTPDTFERAVRLAEAGSIDLAGLVTLRMPLSEGARVFEALVAREGIKTIVEPATTA